jgi:beta-glucosidase
MVCNPCPKDIITEHADCRNSTDDYSDDIILNVASACSNTIVVIHNAGIRLVDTWIDHPNITAVMFAHLPGQDSGRAAVSLLFGDESPSGKMTYTVARNESDYNVPIARPADEFFLFPQDDFTEGVYIDYRDFDRKNITPRYEFGFGLTYTTFEYSDLSVSLVQNANTSRSAPESPIIEGGRESLWDVIATASAVVTNTGDVTAKEVAQLYINIPGGPVRQLRGFDKVEIAPGESETVKFTLLRRDLSDWNVAEQAWVLQQGKYPVWVGASSRNLPLSGELTIS